MDDSTRVDEPEQDDVLVEDLEAPAELQDEVAGGVNAIHTAIMTAGEAS